MYVLKQSTAAVVPVGPIYNAAGAVQTGLTITKAAADVKLTLDGAAAATVNADQGGSDAGAAHLAGGVYGINVNATDTATLGFLTIIIAEADVLCPVKDCVVVSAEDWAAIRSGANIVWSNIGRASSVPLVGQFAAGSATTNLKTQMTYDSDIDYNGRRITIISGDCSGVSRKITATVNATTVDLTIDSALPNSYPANNDYFVIT